MDRGSEVPLGRSSALFVFASMALASAVLIISCFLSHGSSYELSYIIVYVWILVLSIVSCVAVCVFLRLRRNSFHFTDCSNSSNETKQSMWIYLIATIICGLGSSVFPVFKVIRVASCIRYGQDRGFQVLRFLSILFVGFFSLAEVLIIVFCRQYRCKSSWSRIIVSILISANCYIFINGLLDVFRAANTNPKTEIDFAQNNTFDYKHVLVFSYCNISGEYIDHLAGKVYTYIYTFPLEFCLLAMCVLGPLWNITAANINTSVNAEPHAREEFDASDQPFSESQPISTVGSGTVTTLRAKTCAVVEKILKFASRWSWGFSVPFVLLVFALQLYVEIKNFKFEDNASSSANSGDSSRVETGNYYVQTIYTYIICIVPLLGYVVSRKGNPSRWHYDTKTVLLGTAALCHLLFVLFETVDSVAVFFHGDSHIPEKIAYFVKIIFHYFGIYFQTMLILKAAGLVANENTSCRQFVYVKGVIIFLAVCNTERWLVDSFLTAPTLKYIEDIQGDDTFGHKNWWLLTRVVFPSVAFFRLFSALKCFEILYLMARSSALSQSTTRNSYQRL